MEVELERREGRRRRESAPEEVRGSGVAVLGVLEKPEGEARSLRALRASKIFWSDMGRG